MGVMTVGYEPLDDLDVLGRIPADSQQHHAQRVRVRPYSSDHLMPIQPA
jgi:hypothetical protein